MLIQSVKPYYFQGVAAVKNQAAASKNTGAENRNYKNTQLMPHPANYYLPVSFSGHARQLTHSEIIDKIGIKNFPSPKIAEMFEAQPDKTLYEVHKEYYAPLLKCETLEEAKEKYPEFDDVIDAKDINLEELGRSPILRKIAAGEIEGASLDNLSLEFLKRRYAQAKGARNSEFYFNISKPAVLRLFNLLNIKSPDKNYDYVMRTSNPEIIEAARTQMKEQWAQNYEAMSRQNAENIRTGWANDDGSRRAKTRETFIQSVHSPEADAARLKAVQTDDYRQKKRQITAESWADSEIRQKRTEGIQRSWNADDGTRREKAGEIGRTVLASAESREKNAAAQRTPESRQKHREAMLERWALDDGKMFEQASHTALTVLQSPEVKAKIKASSNTPEHRAKISEIAGNYHKSEIGQLHDEAKREAYRRHPEITEMMSKIAEEFPMLAKILEKERSGEGLTETEQRMRETYWKRTHEALPGYQHIIAGEFRKILAEWGLKEK